MNGNDAAFPNEIMSERGMSKRELLSAIALMGIISADPSYSVAAHTAAALAVNLADALLEALT